MIVLRSIFAGLPLLSALMLLTYGIWRRLNSKKSLLPLLQDILLILVGAGASFGLGIFTAWQISETPVLNLGSSSILDMDLDRILATLIQNWSGDVRTRIHPLICLFIKPIGHLFLLCTHNEFRAAQLCCCLGLALSSRLLLAAVRRWTHRWIPVLIAFALYNGSFSFLLFAGLPESAPLVAMTTILPLYLYSVYHGRENSRDEQAAFFLASILAMSITITNLIPALIIFLLRCLEWSERPRAALKTFSLHLTSVLLVCMILSLVQLKLYQGSTVWFLPATLTTERTWIPQDPFGAETLASTVTQVLGYPITGPNLTVGHQALIDGQLNPYLSAEQTPIPTLPLRTRMLLLWTAGMLLLGLQKVWQNALARAAALTIAFNLALHILYGHDYLLYSGNWLVAICLLMILGTDLKSRPWMLIVWIGLPLLIYNNCLAISRLRSQILVYGGLQNNPFHMVTGGPDSDLRSAVWVSSTGNISPGAGSCGIHFSLFDPVSKASSLAPLARGAGSVELERDWLPATIITSHAGDLTLREEVFGLDSQTVAIHIRVSAPAMQSARKALFQVIVSDFGPAGSMSSCRLYWDARLKRVELAQAPVLACSTPAENVSASPYASNCFIAAFSGLALVPSPAPKFSKRVVNWLHNLITKKKQDAIPPTANSGGNLLLTWKLDLQPGESRDFCFISPICHRVRSDSGISDLSYGAALGKPDLSWISQPNFVQEFERHRAAWERAWISTQGNTRLDGCGSGWTEAYRGLSAQLQLTTLNPANASISATADRAHLSTFHAHYAPSYTSETVADQLQRAYQEMQKGKPNAGDQLIKTTLTSRTYQRMKTLAVVSGRNATFWSQVKTSPYWYGHISAPDPDAITALLRLMRGSVVLETDKKLVLFSGASTSWFRKGNKLEVDLPTRFGRLRLRGRSIQGRYKLTIQPGCDPPDGWEVRLPNCGPRPAITISPAELKRQHGELILPN